MADEHRNLHRVTVVARRTEVHDFSSAEEARRFAESAKQDPEAWHVWYAVRETPGGGQRILVSLYRSHDMREWQSLHTSTE